MSHEKVLVFNYDYWMAAKLLYGFTAEQVEQANKGDGVIGYCSGVKCLIWKHIKGEKWTTN